MYNMNGKGFILLFIAALMCFLLTGCVKIMSNKRYNAMMTIDAQAAGYGDHRKNIKLMSHNSLANHYESVEDLILVKQMQLDTDLPGFRKRILQQEIDALRKEQEMVLGEIFRRQNQK